MKAYQDLVKLVLENGVRSPNRTGIDTFSYPGTMFRHDMKEGFPLLTTKKMGIRNIASELEGFLKGITDKEWYKNKKCNIWNEWCNPKQVDFALERQGLTRADVSDEEIKRIQKEENDLGPIYGYQWVMFNGDGSQNQVQAVLDDLKNNHTSRRMLVSAWNPSQLDRMALPPCHVMWQVNVTDGRLNMFWYQRSVDVFLGLPYDIASYGILMHLLCMETGFEPGVLTGFLADTHIYENHLDQCKEIITREPYPLPMLKYENFEGVFNFNSDNISVENYQSHERIKAEVAV